MNSPAEPARPAAERRRLRLVPAPQPAVPYDDDRHAGAMAAPAAPRSRSPTSGAVQGTLALAYPLASGLPAVPTPSPRLRIVGRDLRGSTRRVSAVSGDRVADRPPASRWAALIAQAIVEAEVGDRPLSQLVPWTNEQVYDAVAARCSRHAQRTAPARRTIARAVVTSIHVCQLSDEIAEVCATVRWADRARAVALRLDGVGAGWRCTAVSFG